jgi:hypothetical protein
MAWSLALTAPSCEFRVARALKKWDFEHHVFKIRKRVAFRGTARDRLLVAFPGYIFVAADGRWDFLRQRCGITRFVRRQLLPGIVPSLVAATDENGVFPTIELPSRRFHQGQRVRIHGMSLLAGHIAIFQNLVDNDSAIVLLEWMGRWVPLQIDERDLMPETSSRTRRRRRRRNRKARPARH